MTPGTYNKAEPLKAYIGCGKTAEARGAACSRDVEEAVELGGESPARVGEDTRDGAAEVGGGDGRVRVEAGLEVHQCMLGAAREGEIGVEWLTEVHDLNLVGVMDYDRQIGLAADTGLGREGHPVEVRGQQTGAVGLDGHELAGGGVEVVDECGVGLETRFAAGEDNPARRVAVDLGGDFGRGHVGMGGMVGVAEGATEVAAAQAHEDGGLPGMVPFALEGMEDFVYFHF